MVEKMFPKRQRERERREIQNCLLLGVLFWYCFNIETEHRDKEKEEAIELTSNLDFRV